MYFGDVPQHVLFDNAGIIVIERDAVAKASIAGMVKCWRSPMRMASPPRLYRPYRAKTKDKVERFNGYLKGGSCVLLAATLRQAGLPLDVDAANAYVEP